jgi:hypothetical protein
MSEAETAIALDCATGTVKYSTVARDVALAHATCRRASRRWIGGEMTINSPIDPLEAALFDLASRIDISDSDAFTAATMVRVQRARDDQRRRRTFSIIRARARANCLRGGRDSGALVGGARGPRSA